MKEGGIYEKRKEKRNFKKSDRSVQQNNVLQCTKYSKVYRRDKRRKKKNILSNDIFICIKNDDVFK